MATALTPYVPDPLYSDPSTIAFQKMYITGIIKDPLVHYNHLSRILIDTVHAAGAGGVLLAPAIFSSRNVFNAAATGAWQLPTAALLLEELYLGVFGGLFPKRGVADDFQSYEALAYFRNDTALPITLTTNTGLTLFPSPITIPANSSVNLIFEVVGSTFATAAFNVYVDGSGSGANAPSSIIVAATGGLQSVLVGNTYTISPALTETYSFTATGPVYYNPATNTLSYFGLNNQRSMGGSPTGPASATTTMQTLVGMGSNVTSPPNPWFSYVAATGIYTMTVAQDVSITATSVSNALATLGVTVGGTSPAPANIVGSLTMTIVRNGLIIAQTSSISNTISINLENYPVAAGDTLQIQVGISTGTLTLSPSASWVWIGTMS